ncbi:hypothetical protein ACIBAC_00085 [Streptomyces sp. NPDC051362]|uniref:hypothetical protein n=1 Tax=Streptomyces sp. NPDC051362 TaxID=3365651 RepID=UPI0037B3A499
MTVVAEAPTDVALERRLALVACGEHTRPGKTQACESCLRKAAALLDITITGAVDALAATICGTKSPRYKACDLCKAKAARMIAIYNGEIA